MEIGNVVLFRKNNSLISKAIAFVTSSSYTHAGIIYDVSEDTIITAEAQANGFVKISRSRLEFEDLIECREICILKPRVKLEDVKFNIDLMLGKGYDYLDLLKILINKITGHKTFKRTANKVICSEAVAILLKECSTGKLDLAKEFNKDVELITPDDLNQSRQLKN